VIAAGTIITGSTPVFDLVNGVVIKPGADRPLVIPSGAVVVPARGPCPPTRAAAGHFLATPVIVEVPRLTNRHTYGTRSWIR